MATIGIPTFNRATSLKRAIESAQGQNWAPLEILVVDNCSPDDTESTVRSMMKNDDRVRYFRQSQNLGPVRNFETALMQATGHYFMWLADDDWISPNYVSACISKLESEGHVLVTGQDFWDDGTASRKEPLVEARSPEAAGRVLEYLVKVSSNAAIYGLGRSKELRQHLPFPRYIGGDMHWVMSLAEVGSLGVAAEAELHRSIGGISWDFTKVAAQLDLGWTARHTPRVAIAFGVVRYLAKRESSSFSKKSTRLKIAIRAGLITWIRVGATGELTGPFRRTFQRLIPRTGYQALRWIYRPVRKVLANVRSQVIQISHVE